MLSVKIITEYTDLLAFKNHWDSLFLKSGIQTPFLTADWFLIAYDHFDKQNDLFVLVVQDEQEVIGIAPFIISKEKYLGLTIKKLCFLNNVHTPSQDFIISERKSETISALADFLQLNTRCWDVFELKEIREDSEHLSLLEESCGQHHFFHHRFFMSTSWAVSTNISLKDTMAKISGSVKRKSRKFFRRLEDYGHTSFEVITDCKAIEDHLGIFFKFYEQSWKGKEKNSDFYYKIARAFCQTRQAVLFTLCVNQKPVAYIFSIKSGKILYGRKTTFDTDFYAFSPGTALLYKIFEYCLLSDDIAAYDFGRGNEQYKQNFASIPVNQFSLLGIHKKTVVSYVFYLRYKLVLYIKNMRYSNAGLKFIQRTQNWISETSRKLGTKILTSGKHSNPVFYLKSINQDNKELVDHEFTGKYAGPDDVYRLAAIVKARRFTEVAGRLEKEKCYLIIRNNKIEHCFWFSQDLKKVENLDAAENRLILVEYDSSFPELDHLTANKILNLISSVLASEKYEVLVTASEQGNLKERTFLESLGFKMFKETR